MVPSTDLPPQRRNRTTLVTRGGYGRLRVIGCATIIAAAIVTAFIWQQRFQDGCFLYQPRDAQDRPVINGRILKPVEMFEEYRPALGDHKGLTSVESTAELLPSIDFSSSITVAHPQSLLGPDGVITFHKVKAPVVPKWSLRTFNSYMDGFPYGRFRKPSLWSKLSLNPSGSSALTTNYFSMRDLLFDNHMRQFFPTTNLSVYYAPGIDAASLMLYPLVVSNRTGLHPIRTTLHRTLASNGFSIVRLDRSSVKIYLTATADKYANAPVPQALLSAAKRPGEVFMVEP